MSEELKPCPFCGSDNVLPSCWGEDESSEDAKWAVECLDCEAQTGVRDSEAEAREAWQQRA